MIDAVLIHQAEAVLDCRFGRNADEIARHDVRDFHPGGALVLCGDLVGDVALRNDAEQLSIRAPDADRAQLFFPKVLGSLMNTCVFDDGEDMLAGTNQLRDLHGSSRRGFSVSLGPRAVLMQLESGSSWRGSLVRRLTLESRKRLWS